MKKYKNVLLLLIVPIFISIAATSSIFGPIIHQLVGYLPGKDLTGHLLFYGIIIFIINKVTSQSVFFNKYFIIIILFQLIDEVFQGFISNRTASVIDLLAGILGTVIFNTLYLINHHNNKDKAV